MYDIHNMYISYITCTEINLYFISNVNTKFLISEVIDCKWSVEASGADRSKYSFGKSEYETCAQAAWANATSRSGMSGLCALRLVTEERNERLSDSSKWNGVKRLDSARLITGRAVCFHEVENAMWQLRRKTAAGDSTICSAVCDMWYLHLHLSNKAGRLIPFKPPPKFV